MRKIVTTTLTKKQIRDIKTFWKLENKFASLDDFRIPEGKLNAMYRGLIYWYRLQSKRDRAKIYANLLKSLKKASRKEVLVKKQKGR